VNKVSEVFVAGELLVFEWVLDANLDFVAEGSDHRNNESGDLVGL
jgi:hypothetical protein